MAENDTSTVKKSTPKKKAPAKAASTSVPKQVGGGYSITTKQDGFRRADRTWQGTTTVGPDELTKAQIAQLENDSMFIVVRH